MKLYAPKAEQNEGGEWYIPPMFPNWDFWIGPYATKEEADDDRAGLMRCCSGIAWKLILDEIEETFEDQWEEAEDVYASYNEVHHN